MELAVINLKKKSSRYRFLFTALLALFFVVTSAVHAYEGDTQTVVESVLKAYGGKDKITKILDEIKRAKVKAPVKIGQKIIKNVEKTGVDIVATKPVKYYKN